MAVEEAVVYAFCTALHRRHFVDDTVGRFFCGEEKRRWCFGAVQAMLANCGY